MPKPTVKTIAGQPSWVVRTKDVELAVTQLGGHMAPVTFYRASKKPVQPYYISPWQGRKVKVPVPVLAPLRGDFFCLPFGIGCEYKGETHELHGETSTRKWSGATVAKCGKTTTLTMTMRTRVRKGKVTKKLTLVDGQNIIYDQNTVQGFAGPSTVAHHATLGMPDEQESVLVATSPYRFAHTNPTPTGDPAGGEYQALAVNAKCKRMSAVPTLFADVRPVDCTKFPTRKGYTDLLAMPHKVGKTPAWTTATFTSERFLWFSLKDPAVLPTLMLWMANHGRHQAPWNSENACLGLEDLCGWFAEGLVPSLQANAFTKAGTPTTVTLEDDKPLVVNYIQGVARVPKGFGKVRSAKFAPGKVTFVDTKGQKINVRVCHEFLKTGELCY